MGVKAYALDAAAAERLSLGRSILIEEMPTEVGGI